MARDRYEDDVAELTAERDKWRRRAEQVRESYLDAKDSRDKAQIENACLREAIEDFMQKKQPYAFDADDPLGSLRTIRRYVDELRVERDELQVAIDAMGNGQFYAMYRKACEERDHFKDLANTKQTK